MISRSILRYKVFSGVALFLLLFDLLCNTTFLIYSHLTLPTLLIYIIQDVSLVLSFILIAFGIFSTSAAQAGQVGDVVLRFRWTVIITLIYITLSVTFHWWSLKQRWNSPDHFIWDDGMVAFFTIQRLASAFYYYLVKRTILRLSDGKLYTMGAGNH